MFISPEDTQIIKFFLEFHNELHGVYEIDMPIGFDDLEINMKTNTEGLGRYVTFGEEIDLIFIRETYIYGHQFDLLRYYAKKYAWHSDIDFYMTIRGIEFIRGKVRFEQNFNSDLSNQIKAKAELNTIKRQIESKKNIEIDLNSNKSIDGLTPITPIEKVDILTKAQKIKLNTLVQTKEEDNIYPIETRLTGLNFTSIYPINIFSFKKSINDVNFVSFPIAECFNPSTTTNLSYTQYDNQTEISYRLKNIDITAIMRLQYFYKLRVKRRIVTFPDNTYTVGTAVLNELIMDESTNPNYVKNELSEVLTIPQYSRLSFIIEMEDNTGASAIEKDNDGININKNIELEIDEVKIFQDTTTKCVKLIDIGEQIVKSTTNGNAISNFDAIRFKSNYSIGKINFNDLYCTNGLYLRGFDDVKFTAKWNDWVNFLRDAINCDYQLYNNKIYVKHYTDLRVDIEMARFDFDIDTKGYDVEMNQRIIKSNFKISYKKYEDDETNTLSSIHQEANYIVVNTLLDDSEINNDITYIADAYKIEYTRREYFTKDSTKGTKNDKDIYVIDTTELATFPYIKNRTNEGIEYTYNIFAPDTFYNIRLSLKRILYDYYNETLSDISQFNYLGKPINNVEYKANKNAVIKYLPNFQFAKEKETVEGGDIEKTILNDPLVGAFTYTFYLANQIEFTEFYNLLELIFTENGYFTFFTKDKEIKIFPIELKYKWKENKLQIKGEEKWTTNF